MKPILNSKAIKRLCSIVGKFKDDVVAPKQNSWKRKGDGDLWISVLGQIAVVGSSASGDAIRKAIPEPDKWYADLAAMEPERRLKKIHALLRSAGVRYVTEDVMNCKKSAAANYNFAILTSHGGPRAYLEKISAISLEEWRIAAVSSDLSYIKNKGARDLLIALGIVQNAIAFDTRLTRILKHVEARLPSDLAANKLKYKALESELIENVCKPSKITGAHFDRILFNRYNEIIR